MAHDGWRLFDQLARHPAAVGDELYDAFAHGEPLPDLRSLSDETLQHLCQRVLMDFFRSRAEGSKLKDHLAESVGLLGGEADRRGLDVIGQFALVRIGAAREAQSTAMKAQADGDFSAARLALTTADRELDALPATIAPWNARDAVELRVEIALHRAELESSSGEHELAERSWHDAMASARQADGDAGAGRHFAAVASKYAGWIGSQDADSALRVLLPLVEPVLMAEPTVERLKLYDTLARLYMRHGDKVAVLGLTDRMTRDLNALGFPDSDDGTYEDVLTSWVAAALQLGSRAMTCLQAIHVAVTSWQAVAGLRLQCGAAVDEGLLDRQEAAGAFAMRLIERQQKWHANDAQPNRGDLDLPPVPTAPDPHVAAFGRLASRLLDEGDLSDEVVAGFAAIAADAKADPKLRAEAANKQAYTLRERGDKPAAQQAYRGGIDLAQRAGALDVEVEMWTALIIDAFQEQDHVCGLERSKEAVERIETIRAKTNAPYLASAFMAEKIVPYHAGIAAAEKLGEWGTLLAITELLKARALQAPPPRGGDGALVRELERLSDALATAPTPSEREAVRAQRQLVWDRWMLERHRQAPAFELARLQRMLGARTVVLSYFFLNESILIRACVTSAGVTGDKLVLDDAQTLSETLAAFDRAASRSRRVLYDLAALAPVLLPAMFETALEAAEQVIVCPHQALHQIPFAALPWRGAPLILTKAVSSVPNLTCLTVPGEDTDTASGLVAIATRHSQDPSASAPLPNAEREAREAVTLFAPSAQALLGEAANRKALRDPDLREAISTAKYVLIALHGSDVSDEDVKLAPMEARLYFQDGPVDGVDIATWSLSADLVILSACHAAKRASKARGLDRLPADSVFGLQAAFHEAGAGAVFGALWPANDSVAPRIIGPLLASLRAGLAPSWAVQTAMKSYLTSAQRPFSEPSFWACFHLVGFRPETFGLFMDSQEHRDV